MVLPAGGNEAEATAGTDDVGKYNVNEDKPEDYIKEASEYFCHKYCLLKSETKIFRFSFVEITIHLELISDQVKSYRVYLYLIQVQP